MTERTRNHWLSSAPSPARRTAFLVAALVGFLGADAVSAQAPSGTPGRTELTVFARAHLDMNEARDEFHAAIAAAHEEPVIERVREAFNERVAEIMEEHALTQARYDQLLVIVSTDELARSMFAQILAELAPPENERGG